MRAVVYLFVILIVLYEYECAVMVGGLFNGTGAEEESPSIDEVVFRYAIHKVNNMSQNEVLFDAEISRYIPERSSFEAQKSVCRLLMRGIAGIFGPQYGDSQHIVQAVCDTKEIPHIETRWDPNQRVGSCSVNLHPHPNVLSEAYSAVVEAYGWDKYTILYENSESLIRVANLLHPKLKNNKTATVKLRHIESDVEGSISYRNLLRSIRESDEYNIVLDCSIELLPEILKQAQQVSLMGSDHSYLITNLDFYTLELDQYQYGGTNITGFRVFLPKDVNKFVDDLKKLYKEKQQNLVVEEERRVFEEKHQNIFVLTNNSFSLQSALLNDAVQLFASAVGSVLDNDFKRAINGMPCGTEESWQHGYSIINYMKLITMEGLTGEIKFDQEGFRTNFNLYIMELVEEGIRQVGKWNSFTGAEFERNLQQSATPMNEFSLRNKTLKVVISMTKPYAMRVGQPATLLGNEQYEGYCIDLIKELSSLNDNFNYEFIVDPSGTSGKPLSADSKNWSGMIGYILRNEADLACADLTISREREEVVDLTSPFMDFGIAILYREPKSEPPGFFSFLSPFNYSVWISVITAYVSMSLLFFIMGRISPYEWRNPFPCVDDPDELENQFTLSNSFWFTIGALMQQGSEIAPVSVSTRMAAGLWWFFTLIMVSCYTANLAAFLTAKNPHQDFEDFDSLASSDIKYGAKKDGTTVNFFNDSSENKVYKAMFDYMKSHEGDVMVKDPKEGVKKAVSEKEKYAFIMESTQIEYEVERTCNLTQVGKAVGTKGYGIAMKKNSWYLNAFSQTILQMQESGRLSELKRTWWNEKYTGSCPKTKAEEAETLGLANLGGVFLVLAGGVLVAFITAVFEQLFYSWSASKEEDVTLKKKLIQELEFFMRCHGTIKTTINPGSSEEDSENSGALIPS